MIRVIESNQTFLHSLTLTDELPELPEDIWTQILLRVPTKTLVSKVALVSREFRGRVRQVTSRCFIFDPTVWSRQSSQSLQIAHEASHGSPWKSVVRQATSKLSLLKPAHWSRRGSQAFVLTPRQKVQGMYLRSLQPYIRSCTCLRVLVIHPDLDIGDEDLTYLLRISSQLEHLLVLDIRSKPKLETWSKVFCHISQHIRSKVPLSPSLRILRTDIGILGRQMSAANCRNLLYIQDILNYQMSLETVIEHLNKVVNLRVLKLRMSFEHIKHCPLDIWDQLHNLTTLDLYLGRRIDITARMLKVLRLRQVNIEANDICTFAKLLSLEELELSFRWGCVTTLQKLLELQQIQRLGVYVDDFASRCGSGNTQEGACGNLQYFQLTVFSHLAMLFPFNDYVQLPSLKHFIVVAEQMSIDIEHVVCTFKKVKVGCRIDITFRKHRFHEHDCNLLESVGFVSQYYSKKGTDMVSLSYVPSVTTTKVPMEGRESDLVLSTNHKDNSEVLAYQQYLHNAQENYYKLKDDIYEHWQQDSTEKFL